MRCNGDAAGFAGSWHSWQLNCAAMHPAALIGRRRALHVHMADVPRSLRCYGPTRTHLPPNPCGAPAGKFLGFLLRSIFLVNSDLNVIAASTVFIAAGMSASTSALAAVLSDWCETIGGVVGATRAGSHTAWPAAPTCTAYLAAAVSAASLC